MSRHRTRTNNLTPPQIEPDPATGEVAVPEMPTASQAAPECATEPATTSPTPPSGELGVLIDEIRDPAGATLDDLAATTGWQPHTLRAAFSRLRRRGFPIVLSTDAEGRKAYRLAVREG